MWSFELCRRCAFGYDTSRNVNELRDEDVSKLKERINGIAPQGWGPASLLEFYTRLTGSLKRIRRKSEIAESAINKMTNLNYDHDTISEAEDLLEAVREDINIARFMEEFISVHFKREIRYTKPSLRFSDLKRIAENTDRCN